MDKKLVRKVVVFGIEGRTDSADATFEVGIADVVSITWDDQAVQVFFRAEDEKVENSTPRKMEERPMKYFHGLPFIVEDVLK